MIELDAWLRFVLAALATWRATHLVVYEDGPWDVVAHVRRSAGNSFLGRLMDCFYCTSLWVSAGVLLLVRPRDWADALLLWLGMSGAACLLDRAGQDRVTIKTLEEDEDAVLRPEPGERPESSKHAGSGGGY